MAAPIQASPLNPQAPSLDRPKIPHLSLDVLQIISRYADEKTLKNLSQASKDYKKIALKELNERSYQEMEQFGKLRSSAVLTEKTSVLSVYQKTVEILTAEGIIDEPELVVSPELEQSLKALMTNHIAQTHASNIKTSFHISINDACQWKDIKDAYYRLQESCLYNALNHLIAKTENPTIARAQAANCAIEMQQPQLFWGLLFGQEIEDDYYAQFLVSASRYGYFEIAEHALENLGEEVEDEEQWIESVKLAAQGGYDEILRILLQHPLTLSAWETGEAVVAAAKQGHLNTITRLIDNEQIFVVHVGRAIIEALKNDHKDVVKYFFSYNNISSEDLLEIVQIDSSTGLALGWSHQNPEVIQAALNQGNISERVILNFTSAAARKGAFACLKVFLDHNPDNNNLANAALRIASKNGHLEIVNYILQNRVVDHATLAHSFTYAAQANHLEILKLIKSKLNFQLSSVVTGLALGYSSCNNNLEMCQFLLQNFPFFSSEVQGSLFNAIASSHPQIVQELLKTGYIKKQETLLALSMAYPRNNPQILEILRAHFLLVNTP